MLLCIFYYYKSILFNHFSIVELQRYKIERGRDNENSYIEVIRSGDNFKMEYKEGQLVLVKTFKKQPDISYKIKIEEK